MIEMIIPFRAASIGSIEVKRILPFRRRRSVGPFVFADEMGPVEIFNGRTLDVLSHPHIGLATVTYLFSGRMMHRDSIGSAQMIKPGDVNWMSSGRWIIHSERASDAGNPFGSVLSGLQTWVALPVTMEDSEPEFAHYDSAELPRIEGDGIHLTVIAGRLFDAVSPVRTVSSPVYAECHIDAGRVLSIPNDIQERSVYVLSGSLVVGNKQISPGDLVVFRENQVAELRADVLTHLMIIGGDRLDEPRTIWWNFVSSSRERIEEAKLKWASGEWEPIPNESGHVPLPEGSFPTPQPL